MIRHPDTFVTVAEAAKVAGVSRRTIYNWLASGKIAGHDVRVTPGGKRRIRVGALLRRL